MKFPKFAFVKNNFEGTKAFYKEMMSAKGLASSMRYCLVYYVTLLPGLLIYGAERIKDSTLAVAYYSALTVILGTLITGKVRQFGKEVSHEAHNLETTGEVK